MIVNYSEKAESVHVRASDRHRKGNNFLGSCVLALLLACLLKDEHVGELFISVCYSAKCGVYQKKVKLHHLNPVPKVDHFTQFIQHTIYMCTTQEESFLPGRTCAQ